MWSVTTTFLCQAFLVQGAQPEPRWEELSRQSQVQPDFGSRATFLGFLPHDLPCLVWGPGCLETHPVLWLSSQHHLEVEQGAILGRDFGLLYASRVQSRV